MNIKKIFNNTFENKVIFLTGHTGFQGSWLTLWLKLLGAAIGIGLLLWLIRPLLKIGANVTK